MSDPRAQAPAQRRIPSLCLTRTPTPPVSLRRPLVPSCLQWPRCPCRIRTPGGASQHLALCSTTALESVGTWCECCAPFSLVEHPLSLQAGSIWATVQSKDSPDASGRANRSRADRDVGGAGARVFNGDSVSFQSGEEGADGCMTTRMCSKPPAVHRVVVKMASCELCGFHHNVKSFLKSSDG